MPDTAKEIEGVVAGTALVEAADAPAVEGVFEDIGHAFGGNVDLTGSEAAEISEVIGRGIDVAQVVALPLAAVLIMYAGLKKMFSGARGKRG